MHFTLNSDHHRIDITAPDGVVFAFIEYKDIVKYYPYFSMLLSNATF